MKRVTKPRLPIDKEELSKWARVGATQAEMAARLGVSLRTLARRLEEPEYAELIPKAEAELKISLRTKQVQLALAGNVTMLIWLGKQLLGQSDKAEYSGVDGAPLHPPQITVRFIDPRIPAAGDNSGLPASPRLSLPAGEI